MGGAAESSTSAATAASSPLLLPRAPPRAAVGAEVRRQVGLAAPLVVCSLLQYSLQVVSVMFAGHLGELSLSGASVAASFANVTGFSVLVRSNRASLNCLTPRYCLCMTSRGENVNMNMCIVDVGATCLSAL